MLQHAGCTGKQIAGLERQQVERRWPKEHANTCWKTGWIMRVHASKRMPRWNEAREQNDGACNRALGWVLTSKIGVPHVARQAGEGWVQTSENALGQMKQEDQAQRG